MVIIPVWVVLFFVWIFWVGWELGDDACFELSVSLLTGHACWQHCSYEILKQRSRESSQQVVPVKRQRAALHIVDLVHAPQTRFSLPVSEHVVPTYAMMVFPRIGCMQLVFPPEQFPIAKGRFSHPFLLPVFSSCVFSFLTPPMHNWLLIPSTQACTGDKQSITAINLQRPYPFLPTSVICTV